jgi:transaldolase/glucose-6-phosphate isomerase
MNPLRELQRHGQSVWMDYIQRSLLLSGALHHLVDEDGLSGVTSNPAIFEKAITADDDYTNTLKALKHAGLDAHSIYERLVIHDIQDAADVIWPVYQQTKRRDGYVSIEVSPYYAHDTAATVREARRLWDTIARENVTRNFSPVRRIPSGFSGQAPASRMRNTVT